MNRSRAQRMLERMAGKRIVVVGDLFLDEYLVGSAERLSREGPVPVLRFKRRFCRPGGAANPAWNVVALGSSAVQIGVTGDDDAAAELASALIEVGIETDGVVADPGRPTSVKTRVVADGTAGGQQVARIDRLSREPVPSDVEAKMDGFLEDFAAHADAILVSNYRSGVVTERLCDTVRRLSDGDGPLLTADAQGDLDRFWGFDLVRVAQADAAAGMGRRLQTEPDFESAAENLRRELSAGAVILGRGSAGMSVSDDSGYAVVPPANVSDVFDVTGAGDTVIAVVTLALAAGLPIRSGVELANLAAGIVVRRLGVTAPTRDEIVAELKGISAEE